MEVSAEEPFIYKDRRSGASGSQPAMLIQIPGVVIKHLVTSRRFRPHNLANLGISSGAMQPCGNEDADLLPRKSSSFQTRQHRGQNRRVGSGTCNIAYRNSGRSFVASQLGEARTCGGGVQRGPDCSNRIRKRGDQFGFQNLIVEARREVQLQALAAVGKMDALLIEGCGCHCF